MDLFKNCQLCKGTNTAVIKRTSGTFLQVTQTCNVCQYDYKWNSQSFVYNVSAGNILLSASILFSGALSTQVFRILDFFGCSSINLRTFFRHQHKYLLPSVLSVWKEQQSITFAKMNDNGQTLILGGEGGELIARVTVQSLAHTL